jgi:hypothetical protein
MRISNKHQKTLRKIFEIPIRSDVEWVSIESLITALGGEISEGRGSRVRVALNGLRAVFHRPHPTRLTDKGALKAVKRFLENANVNPKDV